MRFAIAWAWLAAQLVGPFSAVALASGEHLIGAGSTVGVLVLHHEHRSAGDRAHRHHRSDVGLVSGDGSGPHHHDHVVRLPQAHLVKQREVTAALSPVAGLVSVVRFEPSTEGSSTVAAALRGASRPASRSTPLLL